MATVIFQPGFSRRNCLVTAVFLRFLRVAGITLAALYPSIAAAQEIVLNIAGIDGPSFSASNITGTLRAAGTIALDLRIAEVRIAGNHWRNVRLRCPELKQERDLLICAQGNLEAPASIPVKFRYSTLTRNLDLELTPAKGELWRLTVESRAAPAPRVTTLSVEQGLLTRLASWWPPAWPKPNAGTVSGKLVYTDADSAQASAELALANLGFSDESGLHAGEKIVAGFVFNAQQRGEQWLWQARIGWKSGDIFWQPVFASGAGHELDAAGAWDSRQISMDRGTLALTGIGNIDLGATLDRASGRLVAARLKTVDMGLAATYDKFLKPMLQGTALGDLRSDGRMDITLEVRDGELAAADLVFRNVSVEDNARRFAVFGLEGRLPWQRTQPTAARLKVQGGEILRVPFGAFDVPLEMRGTQLRVRDFEIPVLDGKLTVKEFAASSDDADWRWRFSGAIAPIAMERITTTLELPVMHGTVSAEIPAVSYQKSTLMVNGALLFKVFDGTVVAQNLVLEQPFGKVPRLTGNVDMRNLDLELLTRTFSFGNITGRVDARIRDLELVNWAPARFDARVASSAGEYPKRISQAAVQNISALGGAGAAAAIQRSFLSFFKTFGYSALGLSCKLDSGVCEMGGIENVPQGYVIVKGGGIPAINVLGYNRSVGWRELIERLKRITEGNVVVK